MGAQSLAKSVILQSIEDLYDRRYHAESVKFFAGRDFTQVAELAGMTADEQLRLLHLVSKINSYVSQRALLNGSFKTGRVKPSPRSLPVPSSPY